MRSSSDEIMYSQQNLWILDERLTYHSFISSDKALRTVPDLASESKRRPDLFIFDRKVAFAEGDQPISSLIVVEFKRPQRNQYSEQDNPLDQIFDMVRDIRSGQFLDESKRPISVASDRIPAQCYIVCDITPALKRFLMARDANPTPDGQGFYDFHRNFGIYYEVIDYNKVVRDAKKRNRIFFEKLNLLGGSQPG